MSIKVAAKQRLLWAIRQVVSHYGRVILICDARNLRIVSSACAQSEILDEGVDLVELVTKRRQPLKGRVALYLLDDSEDSIREFTLDFTPGKEIYKSAFLMFNCHMLDDSNLRLVASSVDIERVLGCVEMYLNFVAYEDYVFHGNCFNLFKTFPTCSRSHVHGVASRLTSVISTLDMKPQIRFQNCVHGIASAVASSVVELLEASTNVVVASGDKRGSAFTSLSSTVVDGSGFSNTSTSAGDSDLVLILCRCLDPCCLFVHDYSYQSLVYDVLDIGCCQSDAASISTDTSHVPHGSFDGTGAKASTGKPDDVYEFTVVTNMGRQERRSALLNTDVDAFWLDYRTLHIQDVNSKVMEQVDALGKFKANAGIGASPVNVVGRDGADGDGNAATPSAKDGKVTITNPSSTIASTFDLVRNFPLLLVKLEKCWAHVKLTEACFAQIETRQLLKVGALEQMIVTNLDRHGKHHQSYSKCLQQLLVLLGDGSIRLEERIRCILLFLHCYRNTSANDLHTLYNAANLDSKSRSACDWILALDLSITSPIGTRHSHDVGVGVGVGVGTSGGDFKILHRLEGKCDAYYYYKHHFNDSDYDLDVYCPDVAHVLKRVEMDKLSLEHFPHASTQNVDHASASGKAGGHRSSLNDVGVADVKGEVWNFGAASISKAKPRLLLYFLGGVTFAEVRRVAGDLNSKYSVYIGGDCILVPKRIIHEATRMV